MADSNSVDLTTINKTRKGVKVIFLRHAESTFNVSLDKIYAPYFEKKYDKTELHRLLKQLQSGNDPDHLNAKLTKKGEQQCKDVQTSL